MVPNEKIGLAQFWGTGADYFAPYGGGEAFLLQERASWEVAEICRKKPFKPHPQAEQRRRSAVALVKLILANRTSPALETHVTELLMLLLWKLTEAESSKYRTRFQSARALVTKDPKQLRHEHVYQRSKMIQALLRASADQIDGILRDAVACTVTCDEHDRLAQFDKDYGWERYRKAHIEVINRETGKIHELAG